VKKTKTRFQAFAFTCNLLYRYAAVIKPQDNTELEGLYKSSGNFCTQCEAEGFRRITFFQVRGEGRGYFV
jgi:aminopeptidase N